MKKWLSVLFLVFAISIVTNQGKSFAATAVEKGLYVKDNVTVIINGEEVTFDDLILNKSDHLLLPMRDFYEAIGATVDWNQETKVASSVRNGQTVDLTINSNTAQVNGQNVNVSVAPFLYKYSTYVPLRFVSENLDGKVYWDQEQQQVEIVLEDEGDTGEIIPVPEIIPTLYLNNRKITMEHPILNKGGRMYIPSSYFRDYLQNSHEEWITTDRLDLTISGLQFEFTNGSNKVYVNDELMFIAEVPFIESGEMYVPVNFIVNSFKNGGTLRYLDDSNTMYISLYDYILTSDFLEKSYGSLKVPQLVENASYDGKRELLVSDNPEELTPLLIPSAMETLSEYKVQAATATKEHRVFGWHINNLGQTAIIGLTIQNTSDSTSIEVTRSKGLSQTTSNSWSTFDVGLPLADAVLTDTMLDSPSEGITIAPGETKIIETYNLGMRYLLGFIHDLDIRAVNGQSSSYTIRTVLSVDPEGDLTTIHSDQVPIDQYAAHPRGVWSSSTMKVKLPTYTAGSDQVGYNLSNGKTDHLQTVESSLSTTNGAVGNPGHFGVAYKVDIPIVNESGKLQYVLVKIAGRGGIYSGAVKMNGKTYLIPMIKPGAEYVQLPVFRTSKKTDVINLEIMHAGGSNLPVAVYVETR